MYIILYIIIFIETDFLCRRMPITIHIYMYIPKASPPKGIIIIGRRKSQKKKGRCTMAVRTYVGQVLLTVAGAHTCTQSWYCELGFFLLFFFFPFFVFRGVEIIIHICIYTRRRYGKEGRLRKIFGNARSAR